MELVIRLTPKEYDEIFNMAAKHCHRMSDVDYEMRQTICEILGDRLDEQIFNATIERIGEH